MSSPLVFLQFTGKGSARARFRYLSFYLLSNVELCRSQNH
jgi:hypothetical protein